MRGDSDEKERVMAKSEYKCPKCMGCGKVANSRDEEPWSARRSLPLKSFVAVFTGMVRSKTCSLCGGSGKVVEMRRTG